MRAAGFGLVTGRRIPAVRAHHVAQASCLWGSRASRRRCPGWRAGCPLGPQPGRLCHGYRAAHFAHAECAGCAKPNTPAGAAQCGVQKMFERCFGTIRQIRAAHEPISALCQRALWRDMNGIHVLHEIFEAFSLCQRSHAGIVAAKGERAPFGVHQKTTNTRH